MTDRDADQIGERPARLHLSGYAGNRSHPVVVVGETSARYRIRVLERTRLAGRDRWLDPGETALVPKTAVVFDSEWARP